MNAHLVLTVDAPMDIPRLDERYDLLFDFLCRPPKRSAHSREFDGRKGLKVEYHGPVSDQVCEVVDMRCEMDIDVMSSLSRCMSNADGSLVALTEYRSRSSSTDLKLLPM